MSLKTLLNCVLLLVSPSMVFAGDVFKCSVSGNTVYQDAPCKDGRKVKTQATPSSSQVISKTSSLAELHLEIQAATATERNLQAGMRRDIERTKARLGSKVNDPSSNGENARIQNEWVPKIQAAQRHFTALMKELGRRCPNGAALNASSQSCAK